MKHRRCCLLAVVVTLLVVLLSPATAAPSTRVVGGNDVQDEFQFPYFAQLADLSCGAVLIHDDYLLSAAHCEPTRHPFYKQVYLGSTLLDQGIPRTVQYMQAHPAYLPAWQDYDFLLLKLTSSALVEEGTGWPTGVQTIPLNTNASVPQVGDPLQAMGFGKLSEQHKAMNPILQEVQIQYIDNDKCRDQYGEKQYYESLMFCAGVEGGGRDTCQGDSGGPIVDINTGTLVGLVSFGIGCARPNYSGVNSRVSSAVEWIQQEICRGSDYPPPYCTEQEDYTPKVIPPPLKLNEVGGAFTLLGEVDNYPLEFTFSLTYWGAENSTLYPGEQIFLVHPGTFRKKGAAVQYSFSQLRPGIYNLEFGDTGDDGICCRFGDGNLRIVDDATEETVWRHTGEYQGYLQARILVDDTGSVQVESETTTYQASYERTSIENYPPNFDPEWPGPMPNAFRFAFNVNFKFDAFPEENEYEVYYLTGENVAVEDWETVSSLETKEWEVVDAMNGYQDGIHNHLVSHRLVGQSAGWYWLHIEDRRGDGICCDFRRGWVSMTAPVITTMDVDLVWGNNGEFGSGIDVYFYMSEMGVISHIHWDTEDENIDAITATQRDATKEAKNKQGLGGR